MTKEKRAKQRIPRSRAIAYALAINLFVLLLLALVAELVLRRTAVELDIAVSQARVGAQQDDDEHNQSRLTNAVSTVEPRSGRTIRGRDPDTREQFPIPFNQYGLRDYGVLRLLKQPGERRVVLVGDSFVENLGLPWEQGLSAGLERVLRDRGQALDVLGLGLSGTGTRGQLELMQRFLPDLAPDLVLLCWFNNDLNDLRRELRGETRQRSSLLARSYLYTFLGLRLGALLRSDSERQEEYRLLYQPYFIDGERDPLVAEELARTAELFEQMDDLCRAHGARFAVLTVPNAISFSKLTVREAYDEICALSGRNLADFRPGLAYYTIMRLAQGRGVDCYPLLFADFQRELADKPPQSIEARQALYFAADPHWNASGCEVAAQSIAQWIEQQGLLRAP
ncbi:MAG: hypothetical protein P9M14_12025 [Candidatus Alcyoniella australis]|nr:hypothetical protein [Candidatus Alcyoniella australis]